MYLPNVRMSGAAPSSAASPARPCREVITSSAMHTAPTDRARLEDAAEELRRRPGCSRRSRASAPTSTAGEVVRVLVDQRRARGEIVVGRDHELVGRVPGRDAVREEEDAAVVAAVEDEHLRPPGELPGGGDRHQVRLRARVREADAFEPEPLAHQPGELGLARVDAADARERPSARCDGVEHAPLAVAEQPGGVVAEQVDVLVPVGVDEHGPLAADERQREGLVREDRPRVAARQEPPGLVVEPCALRVARGEGGPLLGDEQGEVGESGRGHAAIVPETPVALGFAPWPNRPSASSTTSRKSRARRRSSCSGTGSS